MKALFRYFDTDNSGVISKEDLKQAFAKTGKRLAPTELQNIITQFGPTPVDQGGITFEGFQQIINNAADKGDE